MDEVEIALRGEAARRRLAGESPRAIARDLGRTRQWVAKWAARYDPHDPGWAEGLSRPSGWRTVRRLGRGAGAGGAGPAGGEPMGAGRRAGDRAGAFEARRGRAARAHDRGDPRACWCDQAPASRPARLEGDPVSGARGGPIGRRGAGGSRRPAAPRRWRALPRAEPDRRRLPPRRDRDRPRSQRPDRARGAARAVGSPRRARADPVRQRRPVRVPDRPGGGRAGVPAPGRHAGVRGAPRAVAQRHDRALQRHLRQALLPPGALRRRRAVDRARRRVRALPQRPPPLQRHRRARALEQTTTASGQRAPRAVAELPAGWPERGKVEFIRFIRSDHKLRILGRAIAMPDGSAYQYVTATLDVALTDDEHNLIIASDQGELLTTGRLPTPAR